MKLFSTYRHFKVMKTFKSDPRTNYSILLEAGYVLILKRSRKQKTLSNNMNRFAKNSFRKILHLRRLIGF